MLHAAAGEPACSHAAGGASGCVSLRTCPWVHKELAGHLVAQIVRHPVLHGGNASASSAPVSGRQALARGARLQRPVCLSAAGTRWREAQQPTMHSSATQKYLHACLVEAARSAHACTAAAQPSRAHCCQLPSPRLRLPAAPQVTRSPLLNLLPGPGCSTVPMPSRPGVAGRDAGLKLG